MAGEGPGASSRYAAFLSLAARRSSRYFLIFALGMSLCLAQTMPNTGAAGFLQPGTGHSCLGAFLRGAAKATAGNAPRPFFAGRPGPRTTEAPPANPPRLAAWMRAAAACSPTVAG